MLGVVGSIVMVVISGKGIAGILTAAMFLISSLGFVLVNGWRQRSQRNAQLLASRREYLAYLSDLRETVRVAVWGDTPLDQTDQAVISTAATAFTAFLERPLDLTFA